MRSARTAVTEQQIHREPRPDSRPPGLCAGRLCSPPFVISQTHFTLSKQLSGRLTASACLYPCHPERQLVPGQAHRVGQGHGVGRWWEPAAAPTCTSLLTALGVLQMLCDIFEISEIEVQKGPAGLLPGPMRGSARTGRAGGALGRGDGPYSPYVGPKNAMVLHAPSGEGEIDAWQILSNMRGQSNPSGGELSVTLTSATGGSSSNGMMAASAGNSNTTSSQSGSANSNASGNNASPVPTHKPQARVLVIRHSVQVAILVRSLKVH